MNKFVSSLILSVALTLYPLSRSYASLGSEVDGSEFDAPLPTSSSQPQEETEAQMLSPADCLWEEPNISIYLCTPSYDPPVLTNVLDVHLSVYYNLMCIHAQTYREAKFAQSITIASLATTKRIPKAKFALWSNDLQAFRDASTTAFKNYNFAVDVLRILLKDQDPRPAQHSAASQ